MAKKTVHLHRKKTDYYQLLSQDEVRLAVRRTKLASDCCKALSKHTRTPVGPEGARTAMGHRRGAWGGPRGLGLGRRRIYIYREREIYGYA